MFIFLFILNRTIDRIVQAEQSGYIIPFVTAIVFLLNCVDLTCNGLYDCEIIMDRLAGDVGVARDRCS